MISRIPTEIIVGRSIGNTTEKYVLIGPQPSMAAASSISSGIDFTKPTNMNMARPAPKPRYTIGIVQGVFRWSLSAVLDSVYMTIWNGTTIEKTQR